MKEKAGLYYHIPFCKSKCPYCDFYSKKYNCLEAEEYIKTIITESEKYGGVFDTVYFGGGTPSIIEPELIGAVIASAKKHFEIDPESEITIECNPSKDLTEAFKLYKKYGVNRVSIGMQSAVDGERFALGRSAGKVQVEAAINAAKNAGIENISLDIMLGTPKQTLASLDQTLDFINKMQVKHISAYMLKIEEGTKFYDLKDRLALPDDDLTAQMYLKTVAALSSMGIKQYEISNFAVPGYESRHNTKYWRLVPYLGIGATAHSFWGGKRFYYDESLNLVQDGDGGDRQEAIMLGLRLCEGIEKSLIKKPYTALVNAGFLVETESRIALTPKGMLVSNTIINELT